MHDIVSVGCLKTPVGVLWFAATEGGVVRVVWGMDVRRFVSVLRGDGFRLGEAGVKIIDYVKTELMEYFGGARRSFSVPVDLRVEGFRRRVLEAVAKIPFGEVRSYRDVAASIGKPGAYRAVGNAVARNPVPIIIPCHRVVKSDSTIGYYGGDESMKAWLLRHEGLKLLPEMATSPALLKIVK